MHLQRYTRTLYIRVIFFITTLMLVIEVYDKSALEAHQDQAPAPPVDSVGEPSCRSLFTITGVPDINTLATAQFLRYSRGNTTNNEILGGDTWTPRHSHSGWADQDVAAAIKGVRHLLQQRSSPSGASTEDYRGLARLLPSLLSFHDTSNHSEEDNPKKEGQAPTLSVTSRIGANGGMLPYVPCVIAPFDDPTTVTACFRERLAKNPLSIVFMGDSKIRELFYEFLQRTESEYHYTVNLQNTTVLFRNLKQNYVKLHEDMVATTLDAPRLRITFCFRTFAEKTLSKFKVTKELQQLDRWATGAEAVPQLLIIGYTSWMMLRTSLDYQHDVLGYLMDVHQMVVPLLEQISQRTRVVVLAQSRYRPYAVTGSRIIYGSAYRDPFSDWSEMVFQYYHRRYREGHHLHATPKLFSTQQRLAPWSEDGEATHNSPRTNRGGQHAKASRDHLVPTGTSGGLWWWDTSLPLNLAAINECEELYRRGLITNPTYKGHLKCTDDHHADKIMLIDLVIMLLNLMCNSVLGAHTRYCCQ